MKNYKLLGEVRRKCSLKDKDVAKMINVSQSAISEYENGIYEPSIDTLIRLSEIYGVTINYLLLEKDNSSTFNEDEIYIMKLFSNILSKKVELLKIKEVNY